MREPVAEPPGIFNPGDQRIRGFRRRGGDEHLREALRRLRKAL